MIETSKKQIFLNGLIKENPTFVMILGMCPTLAVTKTVDSAIGMSLALIFVLFFSNLLISLMKKIVPNDIRIPVYIVVIATLVSIVEMVMSVYFVALNDKLGVFVALIVVNCIILGRAEAFANKNKVSDSIFDALGMGCGFAFAVILIAAIREFLGSGTITLWSTGGMETIRSLSQNTKSFLSLQNGIKFDFTGVYEFFGLQPASFFVSNPGAFVILGLLIGIINSIRLKKGGKKA